MSHSGRTSARGFDSKDPAQHCPYKNDQGLKFFQYHHGQAWLIKIMITPWKMFGKDTQEHSTVTLASHPSFTRTQQDQSWVLRLDQSRTYRVHVPPQGMAILFVPLPTPPPPPHPHDSCGYEYFLSPHFAWKCIIKVEMIHEFWFLCDK